VTVAAVGDLNHGIELSGGYLYASTPSTVYRWSYDIGQAYPSEAAEEVIVAMDRTASGELGAAGGHTTRTLAFDPDGRWLYVSIGSLGNVDADSHRARIRRFDVASWGASFAPRIPLYFNDGEDFADGLRNEVGLAFDSYGVLWGVENGADNLYRDDLGGDIHDDNPGEELNRFREDDAGRHWGYPYCWSEYCLPVASGGSGAKGAGTVWAWPSFLNSTTHGDADEAIITDDWCRANTIPSVLSMPSHSAPLGIAFYGWRDASSLLDSGCVGGFPRAMDGFAFVAYHGSWNRDPPTGYKVVFVPFDADTGDPIIGQQPIDLFRHDGESAAWPESYPIRPVDVQFDGCGRLLVTEDGTGSVILVTYGGGYEDGYYAPIDTDVADGPSCTEFRDEGTNVPSGIPGVPPPPTELPIEAPSVPSPSSSSQGPNVPSEIPISFLDTLVADPPTTVSPPKLLDPPSSSGSFTLYSLHMLVIARMLFLCAVYAF
jgi:glucose/arabinose dehydrogenase